MRTLVLALALVACCKGKDAADNKPAGAGNDGPAKASPTEVFDYLTGGSVHLTDKYPGGVTFTTTVQSNIDRVMLKIDSRMVSATVALDDADKAKQLKKGDSVTVTCKDGSGTGSLIKLTGCSL